MEEEMEEHEGTASPAARKKTESMAEQRGTGKDEDAEAGGPTSKAPIKTTVRRDGGKSLSSYAYQGSVQEKPARCHQKPSRFVLQECS